MLEPQTYVNGEYIDYKYYSLYVQISELKFTLAFTRVVLRVIRLLRSEAELLDSSKPEIRTE